MEHGEYLQVVTAIVGALAAWVGIRASNAKAAASAAKKSEHEAEAAREESSAAKATAQAALIGMQVAEKRGDDAHEKIDELTAQLETERSLLLREVEIANDLRRAAEARAHAAEERSTTLAKELAGKFMDEGAGGGAQGRTGQTGRIKKESA